MLFLKEAELLTALSQSIPKPKGRQDRDKTTVFFPFPHPLIIPQYAHNNLRMDFQLAIAEIHYWLGGLCTLENQIL